MKKFFLSVLLALFATLGLTAQVVYEDFEGGMADLAWNGLNGTYNGAVANPDQSGINTSDWVGSYTNSPDFDFCFALYTFPQALDLREYDQFRMKIWSPSAPCKALLKLEGAGGLPIEKIVDITEANKWVEYTFDFYKANQQTNLKTILVSFNSFVLGDDETYYFDDIVAYKSERCYEDFEAPSDISWAGFNGTYNGVVPNPADTLLNMSPNVGSYTNNPASDFNFVLGTFNSGPIDLKDYNQFKLHVGSFKPTNVLLKVEGGGQSAEMTKYMPTAGWRELTFDLSAAEGFTTIDKVLISFNPFKLDDTDTYYFDNLCAVPNYCKGVTKDPEILDDFECNRNANYGVGWDSLYVVNNPAPDGANASAKVGEWRPVTGSSFAALVFANENPIDLTTRNRFGMKVWAPKAGNLLLKIEGGSGPKEIAVPITELNKWVEYSVDFSDQVGKGHTRLVAFFNAGVPSEAGDIYYFDDVKLAAPSALPPIEDFEDGLSLGWQALDQNNPIHGNFTGPTTNPNPNSVNDSDNVGCYSKGSSPFSTLQAFSLDNFDLSLYTQFNLDVLSPAGGGTVTMQLSSPTEGNKEAEATVSTPGEWERLSFDFSAYSAITDFSEVRLIFNAGTAASGESWCIDNLTQGLTTIDPCKDAVPIPNIVSDFECQNNFVEVFYGSSDLKVVNNPHVTPGNGSTKVGEYSDPPNAPFAGIGYQFAQPVDLSVYNQLKVKIYSPIANVPFLFKLQGGQQVEIFDTLTNANEWQQFTIDFSNAKDKGNNQLVIFFNVLSDQGGQTYYIDDIRWSRANYNGCVSDFETPLSSFSNFAYFNNGSSNLNFTAVDNPMPDAVNGSARVGEFVAAPDATIFFGMFADLESFIDFKGNKTVKMKVLRDRIGTVTAKNEIFGNAVPPVEVTVANTKVNEWEELTFDFSGAPDVPGHNRFTIFFDIGTTGTGAAVKSYFDDIVIGDGQCGLVSLFEPAALERMKVSPNPTTDVLRVDLLDEVDHLAIFNALGQRVATINTTGDVLAEVFVTRFPPGVYSLTGFKANGQPVGYAKFIKQ